MSYRKARHKEQLVYVVKDDANDPKPAGGPHDSREFQSKNSQNTSQLSTKAADFEPKQGQAGTASKKPARTRNDRPSKKQAPNAQQDSASTLPERTGGRDQVSKSNKKFSKKEVQSHKNPQEEPKTQKRPNNRRGQNAHRNNEQDLEGRGQGEQQKQPSRHRNDNNRPPNTKKSYRDKQSQLKNKEEEKESPNSDNYSEESESEESIVSDIDFTSPSELTEMLEKHLSSGRIECAICYSRIKKTASIWNCSRCYGPFH